MSGNSKGRKQRFGSIRKLASGRWQARYTGPDGQIRNAPMTFAIKRDAAEWLVETEAELLRGDWIDPDAGKLSLDEYTERWVRERDLKPRSREEYERILRLHICEFLGERALNSITSQHIRTWRSDRLAADVGKPTVAKAYRILHAVFATAVDDDLIRKNPCRIKGAGSDVAEERPIATLDQVFSIAAAIQPRFRLLVLLATFGQLRFGELIGLRRSSISTETMEIKIKVATSEMEDGRQYDGDPKSEAGKRPISLPSGLKGDIETHLERWSQPGRHGRLFIGPRGAIPKRRNFNRIWKKALREAGIPDETDLHLHDLRHTGSTWSARSGATLKEIMARIGHSSTRAAMVYQHAARDRDEAIANALDGLIEAARKETES
jgi:integrase